MGALHSPVVEVSSTQGQGRGWQALASQCMQEESGSGGGVAVPCSNKEQLEAIRDARVCVWGIQSYLCQASWEMRVKR